MGISWLLFSSKLVGSILAADSTGVGRQGGRLSFPNLGQGNNRSRCTALTDTDFAAAGVRQVAACHRLLAKFVVVSAQMTSSLVCLVSSCLYDVSLAGSVCCTCSAPTLDMFHDALIEFI